MFYIRLFLVRGSKYDFAFPFFCISLAQKGDRRKK